MNLIFFLFGLLLAACCDWLPTVTAQNLLLTADTPYRDSVIRGTSNYYQVNLPSVAVDRPLTITVTRINGDPDIFADFDIQRPGTGQSQFQSGSYGSDSITI